MTFYAQVIRLPEADQRYILAALFRGDPFGRAGDLRERSLAAVRDYAIATLKSGKATSQRGYRAWRKNEPKRLERPDERTVVRELESWQNAIALATDSLPSDLRASRLIACPQYTEERVAEVVHEFAAARPEGRLIQTECIAWCKEQVRQPRQAGRYPTSLGPFARCGGWKALLTDLGYGHRLCDSPVDRARTPSRFKYSDEQMCEFLRRAAAASPDAVLSKTAYEKWRKQELALVESEVPSLARFGRRFGSWDEARLAAGLPVPRKADCVQGLSSTPYSTAQLMGALAAALSERGPNLSQSGYDQWRNTEIRRLAAEGAATDENRLPTALTLRNHLGDGSWVRARQIVLEQARV